MDYVYLFVVVFGEILIVTIAQYIIFNSHRLDKSVAFLAAIQLIGSKLDAMTHFGLSSLGETESILIGVNLVSYSLWAIMLYVWRDAFEFGIDLFLFKYFKIKPLSEDGKNLLK